MRSLRELGGGVPVTLRPHRCQLVTGQEVQVSDDAFDVEPQLDCYACGPVVPRIFVQIMINGTHHLRAECPGCGRYIKFVAHVEPWLSMVEERPEQGALV